MNNEAQIKKQAIIWNILGSVSAAAISVVLLMVVTRFLSKIDSDIYAFAYSFANMLVVIALFQVRNFQATDISEKYSFTHYFIARVISCTLMIVIAFVYISISKYNSYKSLIIILVCLYRLTDAFSDLYQGMFQQKERLDIAGKSLTFRNFAIFVGYTFSIILFKNLLISLCVTVIISISFILIIDLTKSKGFIDIKISELIKMPNVIKSFRLLKESLVLFLNGFLIIYIYTQPKYSIETMTLLHKIPLGSQTIFNILFMPAFVMNLMMLFFRPQITMMAIALLNGKIKDFNKIQVRLFLFLALSILVVLLGSGILGIPFLSLLYAVNLNNYWVPFMLIMLGGAVGSFATAIDNVLTAMRKQNYLLIPYFSAFLFSVLFTNHFVAKYQLLGASLSFLLTMVFWLLISIIIFYIIQKQFQTNNRNHSETNND